MYNAQEKNKVWLFLSNFCFSGKIDQLQENLLNLNKVGNCFKILTILHAFQDLNLFFKLFN